MGFEDRDEEPDQFIRGFHAEILLIVPLGFFCVETGSGPDNPLQREDGDQFVEGIEFSIVARIPAQEGKHVDEGFREIAVFPVSPGHFSFGVDPLQGEDRKTEAVAIALGKFSFSVRLEKQGQMSEAGHGIGPAECLVQEVVERQGREPLLAADDFRNFHQMVIDDVGEVVGRQFVRPFPEYLVIQRIRVDFDVTPDEVVHLDDPSLGHLEPDGPVRGGLQQRADLAFRKGQ